MFWQILGTAFQILWTAGFALACIQTPLTLWAFIIEFNEAYSVRNKSLKVVKCFGLLLGLYVNWLILQWSYSWDTVLTRMIQGG